MVVNLIFTCVILKGPVEVVSVMVQPQSISSGEQLIKTQPWVDFEYYLSKKNYDQFLLQSSLEKSSGQNILRSTVTKTTKLLFIAKIYTPTLLVC